MSVKFLFKFSTEMPYEVRLLSLNSWFEQSFRAISMLSGLPCTLRFFAFQMSNVVSILVANIMKSYSFHVPVLMSESWLEMDV